MADLDGHTMDIAVPPSGVVVGRREKVRKYFSAENCLTCAGVGTTKGSRREFMGVLIDERTPTDRDRASDGRAGRIPLEVAIQIRSQHGSDQVSWTGVTKNMCAGGVFVATLRSVPIGERVAVRLRIPGDAEPVEALAEVRWSRPFQELDDQPAGLGLRFIDTPLRAARVERIMLAIRTLCRIV
jgi:uncharacterized protein (TIGR02266 family)